jgi:hypothetical protein
MKNLPERPPGLHITEMAGDRVQFSFTTGDGSLVCDITVSDSSLTDAQRKSKALGKLGHVLDELQLIMKDDDATRS